MNICPLQDKIEESKTSEFHNLALDDVTSDIHERTNILASLRLLDDEDIDDFSQNFEQSSQRVLITNKPKVIVIVDEYKIIDRIKQLISNLLIYNLREKSNVNLHLIESYINYCNKKIITLIKLHNTLQSNNQDPSTLKTLKNSLSILVKKIDEYIQLLVEASFQAVVANKYELALKFQIQIYELKPENKTRFIAKILGLANNPKMNIETTDRLKQLANMNGECHVVYENLNLTLVHHEIVKGNIAEAWKILFHLENVQGWHTNNKCFFHAKLKLLLTISDEAVISHCEHILRTNKSSSFNNFVRCYLIKYLNRRLRRECLEEDLKKIQNVYIEAFAGKEHLNELWELYCEHLASVPPYPNQYKDLTDCLEIAIEKACNIKWQLETILYAYNAYYGFQQTVSLENRLNTTKKNMLLLLSQKLEIDFITKNSEEFQCTVNQLLSPAFEKIITWRIHFQLIRVAIAQDEIEVARQHTKDILNRHPGKGRICVLDLQLNYTLEDDKNVLAKIESYLMDSAKCGEILLECARLCMNPVSEHFNLEKAEIYLKRALLYTEQYADIYIEFFRYFYLIDKFKGNHDVQKFEPNWLDKFFSIGEVYYGDLLNFCAIDEYMIFSEITQRARQLIQLHVDSNAELYNQAFNGIRPNSNDDTYLELMTAFGNPLTLIKQNKTRPHLCFHDFLFKVRRESGIDERATIF